MQQSSRPLRITIPLISLAALLVCTSFAGNETIRQRALELRNSLVVLTIALQPGDEDFSAIEELRFVRGAHVTSAYLTNGEAGESDFGSSYPHHLAALRREEATRAIESFEGSVVFLNYPATGALSDTGSVWNIWNRDSLQIKLMRLISSTRPHLILLFPQRYYDEESIAWQTLKENLRAAIQHLRQPKSVEDLRRLAGVPTWEVQRCITGRKVSRTGRGGKESHRVKAAEGFYASQQIQRRMNTPDYVVEYPEVLHPSHQTGRKNPYEGLPHRVPPLLRSLHQKIQVLTRRILATKTLTNSQKQRSLRDLTAVADSVDYLVGVKYGSLRGAEQKTLLVWKERLQNLRNELGGISVFYTLEDTVLTFVQVTTLTIDSVHGTSPGSKLWFFFPPAKDGWIINETRDQRLPMNPGDQFRIVTPSSVPFNLPSSDLGMQREMTYSPIDCFVVQTDSSRLNSFAVRIQLPFRFAPRFTVEVLTPMVRAMDGEKVLVRLTNYSRDGVRDNIGISDSMVSTTRFPFWLIGKESVKTGEVELSTHVPVPVGDYILPLDIGGTEVGRVGMRSIEIQSDSTVSVGLISWEGMSAAEETLRRLRMPSARRTARNVTAEWLSGMNVVMLDHRVYTIDGNAAGLHDMLRTYAEAGGRVIVLSQDAEVWNANPLVAGLTLRRTTKLGVESGVVAKDTTLLTVPNILSEEDWSAWLFERAPNIVGNSSNWHVLLSSETMETPFVTSIAIGAGKITYVNFSLPAQWLNIHGGALRLLANLLVY